MLIMKLSFIFGLIASCAFAGAIQQQLLQNQNTSFLLLTAGIVYTVLFLKASNYKPL